MNKRNIIVITLDSLRADHCSFMGYERKTTPTIDKMARKGLYFENAIAASIATAPSMFTALTGDFPSLESNNYNPKDWKREIATKRTISELLSEKGYFTAAFSPNIAFSSYFGFSKGFQHFDDFQHHRKFRSYERFQRIGSTKFTRFFIYIYDVLRKGGIATPWEDIYDYILSKIKKMPKPYFVWILLLDTHIPYIPPKEYRKWSNITHIIYSNYLAYRGPFSKYFEKILRKLIDARNAYDDCIRYADQFIKNLFNDLSCDDPIFIIHGDHGEGFGEHGFYGHPPGYPVVLYEEFIHIPLVIYNADIKGKVKKPISLKYLPSIIQDLVNTSPTFDKGCEWVISKVFDRGKIKVTIRMKDWKFITGQKENDELYYLKKDPYEQENLIDDHPDLVREMKKIAEKHIKHEMEIRKIREKLSILKRRVK